MTSTTNRRPPLDEAAGSGVDWGAMHHFTPVSALLGGVLIGLSVSLVLFTHGRSAGISGLWGGLLRADVPDRPFRLWFFAGLFGAGLVMRFVAPAAFGVVPTGGWLTVGAAGLLVGYGTRLGGGCTSGHGVCGLSRFETRSLVATVTFMATGAVAVVAMRLLGNR